MSRNPQTPPAPGELVEGVHFYVEAGRWVFTARYHLERGYCCENRCRHCPYTCTEQRPTGPEQACGS